MTYSKGMLFRVIGSFGGHLGETVGNGSVFFEKGSYLLLLRFGAIREYGNTALFLTQEGLLVTSYTGRSHYGEACIDLWKKREIEEVDL